MKTRNVLFELHTLPWSHLAAVRVFLNCMPGQANIVLVMNEAGSLREPECNISGQQVKVQSGWTETQTQGTEPGCINLVRNFLAGSSC